MTGFLNPDSQPTLRHVRLTTTSPGPSCRRKTRGEEERSEFRRCVHTTLAPETKSVYPRLPPKGMSLIIYRQSIVNRTDILTTDKGKHSVKRSNGLRVVSQPPTKNLDYGVYFWDMECITRLVGRRHLQECLVSTRTIRGTVVPPTYRDTGSLSRTLSYYDYQGTNNFPYLKLMGSFNHELFMTILQKFYYHS